MKIYPSELSARIRSTITGAQGVDCKTAGDGNALRDALIRELEDIGAAVECLMAFVALCEGKDGTKHDADRSEELSRYATLLQMPRSLREQLGM